MDKILPFQHPFVSHEPTYGLINDDWHLLPGWTWTQWSLEAAFTRNACRVKRNLVTASDLWTRLNSGEQYFSINAARGLGNAEHGLKQGGRWTFIGKETFYSWNFWGVYSHYQTWWLWKGPNREMKASHWDLWEERWIGQFRRSGDWISPESCGTTHLALVM